MTISSISAARSWGIFFVGKNATESVGENVPAGGAKGTHSARTAITPAGLFPGQGNVGGPFSLDTVEGRMEVDPNDFFLLNGGHRANYPAELLPTADNLATLADYSSARFRHFLSVYSIPCSPNDINYSIDGQMQFPTIYTHANQFTQALKHSPALRYALSTIHSLASQYAKMLSGPPYLREYRAAGTQAEANAVALRHSYQFRGTYHDAQVRLSFTPDGSLYPIRNGIRIPGTTMA